MFHHCMSVSVCSHLFLKKNTIRCLNNFLLNNLFYLGERNTPKYRMIIAVEGCAHGELDQIYRSVENLAQKRNVKVDLLICCGDFQAVRNENDLQCMAVPDKFRDICTFYK